MLYVYPTDTVWGIGASVDSEDENAYIRKVKKNPPEKPLSLLFPHLTMIKEYFSLPSILSENRLQTFFAMQTTLALPRSCLRQALPEWICFGAEFIAFRCLPLAFLSQEKKPITATSLNFQGESPITRQVDAQEFSKHLKRPHQIVTNETIVPAGFSSTMVALSEKEEFSIWREGQNRGQIKEMIKAIRQDRLRHP